MPRPPCSRRHRWACPSWSTGKRFRRKGNDTVWRSPKGGRFFVGLGSVSCGALPGTCRAQACAGECRRPIRVGRPCGSRYPRVPLRLAFIACRAGEPCDLPVFRIDGRFYKTPAQMLIHRMHDRHGPGKMMEIALLHDRRGGVFDAFFMPWRSIEVPAWVCRRIRPGRLATMSLSGCLSAKGRVAQDRKRKKGPSP